MTHALSQGLNTLRLGSARAVAIAWVVLALVGALLLTAAAVGHPPAGAQAGQSQVGGALPGSGSLGAQR